MLTYVSEQHERHTALDLLHIPRSHSSFFDRSFSVQDPKLRNRLPVDIRNRDSVDKFKNALKRYLLSNELISVFINILKVHFDFISRW